MSLALVGCAAVGTGHRAAHGQGEPSPPPGIGTALDGPVPSGLLDLHLVDHHGRPMTLRSLRGRAVVISDMSTLCQETCAIGTASMLQAARAVERAGLGSKVEFLSITIDPTRDDRRHLAAYRRLFGALPDWELLTGSPADITRLWDKLGVWRRTVHVAPPYERDWLTGRPLTTDIQHTDDLIFIGPDQRFRFLIDGPGSVPSPAAIPNRIFDFMNAQGHRNVRDPSPGSWSGAQVQQVLRWVIDQGGATP